jgi:hypothetical protein
MVGVRRHVVVVHHLEVTMRAIGLRRLYICAVVRLAPSFYDAEETKKRKKEMKEGKWML